VSTDYTADGSEQIEIPFDFSKQEYKLRWNAWRTTEFTEEEKKLKGISTTGQKIDATNEQKKIVSFSELFWDAWAKNGYKLPEDITKCYFFVLISKHYTNVCRYFESIDQHQPRFTEDTLLLIGCRNLLTNDEEAPEGTPITHFLLWKLYGLKGVQMWRKNKDGNRFHRLVIPRRLKN
jgi:hypothetical protein